MLLLNYSISVKSIGSVIIIYSIVCNSVLILYLILKIFFVIEFIYLFLKNFNYFLFKV